MSKSQSDEATVESEEHSQPLKSRAEAVLAMMDQDDDEAGNPVEEVGEVVRPEATEVTPPEKEEVPPEKSEKSAEKESEDKEEKPEAEAKAGQQWPDSAKVRVAEETAKRKERTVERDKAIARAAAAEAKVTELEGQLQGASRPSPTPQNPYSDVYDEPSLRKAEREAEKIIEFCETNREGAYDIVVGKNEDGTEKKEDFTPAELTRMKLTAERSLRRDIPERRQYLAMRARADAAAVEAYSDYQDADSELTKFARQVLQTNPALEQIVGPEVLAWIGHAFKGRALFLEEQKGKSSKNGSDAASRILKNKDTQLAPSRLKQRGDVKESESVNVGPAIKKMQESGSDESMEDAIGAIRSAAKARRA